MERMLTIEVNDYTARWLTHEADINNRAVDNQDELTKADYWTTADVAALHIEAAFEADLNARRQFGVPETDALTRSAQFQAKQVDDQRYQWHSPHEITIRLDASVGAWIDHRVATANDQVQQTQAWEIATGGTAGASAAVVRDTLERAFWENADAVRMFGPQHTLPPQPVAQPQPSPEQQQDPIRVAARDYAAAWDAWVHGADAGPEDPAALAALDNLLDKQVALEVRKQEQANVQVDHERAVREGLTKAYKDMWNQLLGPNDAQAEVALQVIHTRLVPLEARHQQTWARHDLAQSHPQHNQRDRGNDLDLDR